MKRLLLAALLLAPLPAAAQTTLPDSFPGCTFATTTLQASQSSRLLCDAAGQLRISGTINATTTAVATAAAPSYVEGSTNPLSQDLAGNIRTLATVTIAPGSAFGILDAGGVNKAAVSAGGALSVAGTVSLTGGTIAATQSGSWNVGVAQGAAIGGIPGELTQCSVTTAAPTYVTATINPVSCDTSGSMRVNVVAGAATGVGQGSTTSGQLGPLVQGAVTTTFPAYVNGQTSPLSLDTSGELRVAGGVAQGSTTSGQNVALVGCATVGSAPTNTNGQTNAVTCATDGTVRVSGGLAQGSTTAGQLGALTMCATTTSPPTNLNGQTNSVSCDTAGNVRAAVIAALPSGGNTIGAVSAAGTFPTQDLADGTVAPGAAGSKSTLGGCQFNAATPSLTTGQQVARQCDTQGNALVSIQRNNVAFADKSGTVALGGTSQQADAAATTSRVYVIVENPCTAATQNTSSTESLFVNFGASATSGGTSFELGACGGFVAETGYIPQGTINVNAASTGHRYTIKVAEY